MPTALEDELTEAMRAAVADARLPATLVDAAISQHRRRTRVQVSVAAAVAATAAAAVIPVALTARAHHAPDSRLHALDAAFIVGQVRAAIADDRDKIMVATTTTAGDWTNTDYIDRVTGRERTHSTSADGSTVGDSYSHRAGDREVTVVVDYQQHTVSTSSEPVSPPAAIAAAVKERLRHDPVPQTADQVASELRAGTVKVAGTDNVDGTSVLKLVVGGSALPPGASVTVWVARGSYELVRMESVSGTPPVRAVTDYQWLARTAANENVFQVDVPDGFTTSP